MLVLYQNGLYSDAEALQAPMRREPVSRLGRKRHGQLVAGRWRVTGHHWLDRTVIVPQDPELELSIICSSLGANAPHLVFQ